MPSTGALLDLRRCAVVVVLAGLLLLAAGPASAHGRGTDATSYDSRIIEVPDVPGVGWSVHGGDELLVLSNRSNTEVLVYGYDGEPCLRVGPDGVFENRRSPATHPRCRSGPSR